MFNTGFLVGLVTSTILDFLVVYAIIKPSVGILLNKIDGLVKQSDESFNAGWTAASNDANTVRESYERIFQTPVE